MRAKVVEAEAEVPRAMAEAFRSGNLGIMDYYKMKNVQADTDMRTSIAKPEQKKENSIMDNFIQYIFIIIFNCLVPEFNIQEKEEDWGKQVKEPQSRNHGERESSARL